MRMRKLEELITKENKERSNALNALIHFHVSKLRERELKWKTGAFKRETAIRFVGSLDEEGVKKKEDLGKRAETGMKRVE